MRWLIVCVLVASSTIAHAGEHDATFAKGFGVQLSHVHDVIGFELPTGNDTTHVLIGRYDYGTWVMTGALLMHCDETDCTWRRAEFGAADAIELDGIVDVFGTPAAIPSQKLGSSTGRYAKVPGARSMKFPVLVIRTRESKSRETRVKLYLISLVELDRGSVILMDTAEDRSPTGRGFVRSYRLDKGDSKTALDVIAKEQRKLDRDSRCLQPEPSEVVFALDDRHFTTKKYTVSKGC